MIHLTVQSNGASEGTSGGATKHTPSKLHKYAQEEACEVTLEGALEVMPVVGCTC